jgi:AcrR family transcriptional regulator
MEVIMPTLPLPHPSNRRERRSIELRERLFRAALDLFAKQGFAETTVEDITNAADVGKGTFFNYFPSKDHILLAFAEMQLETLRLAVEEAQHAPEPLLKFVRSLTVRMTAEPARNPDLIRGLLLAFLGNSEVRQAMRDLHVDILDLHTQMVQIGQGRGEIRDDLPAAEIALVFRQTIFGTLLIWSLYGDASLQSRMDSAFEIIWSGLSPRAPSNLSSSDAAPPVSRKKG